MVTESIDSQTLRSIISQHIWKPPRHRVTTMSCKNYSLLDGGNACESSCTCRFLGTQSALVTVCQTAGQGIRAKRSCGGNRHRKLAEKGAPQKTI
eukprot:3891452-Amphidinium_carterae.1